MSTTNIKTARNVRKPERPRPLRVNSSTELEPKPVAQLELALKQSLTAQDALMELFNVHMIIINDNYDENTVANILKLCDTLKIFGKQLEEENKDELDVYFKSLRNASRIDKLSLQCRARLLEIIELRSNGWEKASPYYQFVINKTRNNNLSLVNSATLPATFNPLLIDSMNPLLHSNSTQMILNQGEVIKNSGKFTKPTKIPGKNYFKDEVVIRNSDSGKVSPGTRDRLVQITGPSDESIDKAKILIEETIRRNASPIRETPEFGTILGKTGSESSNSINSSTSEESSIQPTLTRMTSNPVLVANKLPMDLPVTSTPLVPPPVPPINFVPTTFVPVVHQETSHPNGNLQHSLSMSDANIGFYNYTVSVGKNQIRLSGSNAELVRTAKLVLEEYFAGQAKVDKRQQDYENRIQEPLVQFTPMGDNQSVLFKSTELSRPKQIDFPSNYFAFKSRSMSDMGISVSSSLLNLNEENENEELHPLNLIQTAKEAQNLSPPLETPSEKQTTTKRGPFHIALSYSRFFLMKCALNPFCQIFPQPLNDLPVECLNIIKRKQPVEPFVPQF